MVCFIIFISSYSLNSSLQDAYQNNIKPLHQNYSLANNYYDMKIRPNFFGSYNFYEPKQKKILMTHKNKEISSDIMNFIHYNHTGENISNYDFKTNDSRLNDIYSECIDINIYDIECIISKEDPLFIDDKCLWTFLGYNTVAINKNYYLINMKERMCGSGTLKGNSYYLFNYDGKTIEIMDSIAPGDKTIWTQREIKYFMFVDYGYEFVTSACYEGSDSCKGQRATRSGLRIK